MPSGRRRPGVFEWWLIYRGERGEVNHRTGAIVRIRPLAETLT